MNEIFGFIFVMALIGCHIYLISILWDFIVQTPKQLKRIADALEWRNKSDK